MLAVPNVGFSHRANATPNRFGITLFMSVFMSCVMFLVSCQSLTGGSASAGGFIAEIATIKTLSGELDKLADNALSKADSVLYRNIMAIKSSLDEFLASAESAYNRASDRTFNSIDASTAKVFQDLRILLNNAAGLEEKIKNDANDVIYTTQASLNQILGRLPFTSNVPVVFAARTKELVPGLSADIEIIGYALSDVEMPTISINGHKVSPDKISGTSQKIVVTLDPAVKSELIKVTKACDIPQSYVVSIGCKYKKRKMLVFHATKMINQVIKVDSGKLRYEAAIQIDWNEHNEEYYTDETTLTFEQDGYQSPKSTVFHPDGHSRNYHHTFKIPADYEITSYVPSLRCVNEANGTRITNHSRARNDITVDFRLDSKALEGKTAYATVVVRVTGKHKRTRSVLPPSDTSKITIDHGGMGFVEVPQNKGSIKELSVDLTIKGCKDLPLDTAQLRSPANGAMQTSDEGLFTVDYTSQKVTIKAGGGL